jgi:serine kinase of HPr protein (carbohydrate metabolism regulator)
VYALHTAALERDGRAVLVLGSSGAGKSTCLLSMIGAGWRCLSDDHPLLSQTPAGLRVLPWPARAEMTLETPERFGGPAEVDVRAGERKLWCYPDELGAGPAREPAAPALLLFPKVVD